MKKLSKKKNQELELKKIKTIESRKKNKCSLSANYNIYNTINENNALNLKTSYRLISHFKDNLFFAQDYESLKICCFENNTFTSVYQFNFNILNLCILKNYDLIIYGGKKFLEENNMEYGSTYRGSIDSKYDYFHYKYLQN